MIEKRTLADVLERLAVVGSRMADGLNPYGHDGTCIFCFAHGDTDPHELWCAYEEGRKLSESDIVAVRRLARVLRYEV